MQRLNWGIIAFCFVMQVSFAEVTITKKFSTRIGIGLWGNNLSQRFSATSGYEGQVSQLSGIVTIDPELSLGRKWVIALPISSVLPWRNAKDGSSKTFTLFNSVLLGKTLSSKFWVAAGPGIQWTFIHASGETLTLRNGNSTSTFYTPDGTATSMIFTSNFAARFQISPRWYVQTDFSASNIMSSLKRRFTSWILLGIAL